MPRLYEMYVLSLLRKAYGDQIQFQVRGRHKTMVDFIKTDEKIIMDTKYKPHYESGDSGIVDDVREISGYARDKSILKALEWYKGKDLCAEGKQGKLFPDCVIIYPIIQPEYNDDGESFGIQEQDCVFWDESNPPEKIVDESHPKLCNPIAAFEGFYKIAVPLPQK
jgi:5-methylcytosine-specific restriction enzyme subunit McrC